MPNKTDLNDVNLLQLYQAQKQYDQLISNAEGVKKATKDVWQFASLWNLHKRVVPTRDNMSLSQAGQPVITNWRHSDFLYKAESIERDHGYPKGLLNHSLSETIIARAGRISKIICEISKN